MLYQAENWGDFTGRTTFRRYYGEQYDENQRAHWPI